MDYNSWFSTMEVSYDYCWKTQQVNTHMHTHTQTHTHAHAQTHALTHTLGDSSSLQDSRLITDLFPLLRCNAVPLLVLERVKNSCSLNGLTATTHTCTHTRTRSQIQHHPVFCCMWTSPAYSFSPSPLTPSRCKAGVNMWFWNTPPTSWFFDSLQPDWSWALFFFFGHLVRNYHRLCCLAPTQTCLLQLLTNALVHAATYHVSWVGTRSMAWSLQAAVRKLPGVSRSEQKMDTDSMVPQQQLPQIAARLHVMEPRLEAKQAVLTELSAADYKSRTGGGGGGGCLKGRELRKSFVWLIPFGCLMKTTAWSFPPATPFSKVLVTLLNNVHLKDIRRY